MAIFKCVHTGCLYEWTDKETVDNMRKHTEYTEVVPVVSVEKEKKKKPFVSDAN